MIPGPAQAGAALRPSPLDAMHPAVRLGGAALGIATVFSVPPALVPAAALLPAVLLARTGLAARRQAAALRPWWSVALLVLLVHTLTTTAAAPLGRPSWAGVLAGAVALCRVAGSAAWLAVLVRTTSLDGLMSAVRWWLAPVRKLGLRDDDLPLVLAVALGTAPTVLGEARRIEAVIRLRRGRAAGGGWRGRFARQRDRARVVVPLLETLARRAEALSLTLRRRRPLDVASGAPSWPARLALLAWAAALVAAPLLRRGGAG